MQMTKREKLLLGVVSALLLMVLYYQFVYVKQVDIVKEKRVEKEQLESEYNRAIQIISNMDHRESELKIINSNILDKYEVFYPTISQEHIILEIDKLLEDSGVEGDIVFSESEIAAIDVIKNSKDKEDSSLAIIANKYKGLYESNEVNEENSTIAAIEDGEKATTEHIKAVIKFNASYDQLMRFIRLIDNYHRKVIISDLSMEVISQSMLSGVMTLEFYSVPKLDNEDEENYLLWQLENIYGKDIPFSEAAATGTNNILEGAKDKKDFIVTVRSINSELPALVIGKANDESRLSYIYGDKNSKEDIQINFIEEEGTLKYRYSTSTSSYPKGQSFKEFSVTSNKIVIEINSESRVSSNDKSSAQINIVNNTSKVVEVIIKNDDATNGRVNIISEGGTVNVTKQ